MTDKLNISSRPNEPVPALAMNSWSMQHTGRSCTGFKFSLRDISQVCVKDMNHCFACHPVCANRLAVDHTRI